jgi:exocyst complex component 8
MHVSLDRVAFIPWNDGYVDLKIKLANSTEAELRSLQSSLHSSKDDTNLDLRRNVFKQYVSDD